MLVAAARRFLLKHSVFHRLIENDYFQRLFQCPKMWKSRGYELGLGGGYFNTLHFFHYKFSFYYLGNMNASMKTYWVVQNSYTRIRRQKLLMKKVVTFMPVFHEMLQSPIVSCFRPLTYGEEPIAVKLCCCLFVKNTSDIPTHSHQHFLHLRWLKFNDHHSSVCWCSTQCTRSRLINRLFSSATLLAFAYGYAKSGNVQYAKHCNDHTLIRFGRIINK